LQQLILNFPKFAKVLVSRVHSAPQN